jgi:hypothetical protein
MINLTLKTLEERFGLKRAERCIGLYKNLMKKIGIPKDDVVKAFTVRTQELLEAVEAEVDKEGKIIYHFDHVRVYLGLSDEAKPEKERPSDFKMFLVPVDAKGCDVIPGRLKGKGKSNEEQEYVYDLIAPCPNTCDTTSDLYKAGD